MGPKQGTPTKLSGYNRNVTTLLGSFLYDYYCVLGFHTCGSRRVFLQHEHEHGNPTTGLLEGSGDLVTTSSRVILGLYWGYTKVLAPLTGLR